MGVIAIAPAGQPPDHSGSTRRERARDDQEQLDLQPRREQIARQHAGTANRPLTFTMSNIRLLSKRDSSGVGTICAAAQMHQQ